MRGKAPPHYGRFPIARMKKHSPNKQRTQLCPPIMRINETTSGPPSSHRWRMPEQLIDKQSCAEMLAKGRGGGTAILAGARPACATPAPRPPQKPSAGTPRGGHPPTAAPGVASIYGRRAMTHTSAGAHISAPFNCGGALVLEVTRQSNEAPRRCCRLSTTLLLTPA